MRYEVAICIQTGHIIWINGPNPCGAWPDIKISRHKLAHKLGPNEMVEADLGYRGQAKQIRTPHGRVSRVDERAGKRARARQETINGKMKCWKCLTAAFRHPLDKHCDFFKAVAVCTQIGIETGENKAWQVRY